MIGFGQNVYIPDVNFKACLVGNSDINTNGDAEIQVSEANVFNGTIDCTSLIIYDLTGVEAFTALTHLDCKNNQLTSLDVSQNTALTDLDCFDNQITILDVSQNTALRHLNCQDNQLTILDVSQNTALNSLYCGANQLTSLDLSQNSLVGALYCSNNQLTTIDVSNNTALTDLYCSDNQLTTIDVSNNTALEYLGCSNNQLTTIDVSGCTALEYLGCHSNQLTTIDVSNNTALTDLHCPNNQLTTIDVSGCTTLTYLGCFMNQLTTIDVSGCTALESLSCFDNELTSLDVSNTALTYLDFSNAIWTNAFAATIQWINFSNNNNLEWVNASSLNLNSTTTLGFANNANLKTLDISYNQFECFDISNIPSLENFDCSNNLLEQLTTRNGNFNNMYVNATNNNLTCVEVDNVGVATNDWDFDSFTTFSTSCNYTNPCNTTSAIQDYTTNKELLKLTDLLGRETKGKKNTPLFYIYDDGTVEKRITID